MQDFTKEVRLRTPLGLASYRYLDFITQDTTGFRIVFYQRENFAKQVHLIFDKPIEAYRSINESYLLNTMGASGQSSYGRWTFFKVDHSTYLKALLDKFDDTDNVPPFIHFSFITDDEITDVIATYEPKIEFITEKEEK